jgi:hypothetical protein
MKLRRCRTKGMILIGNSHFNMSLNECNILGMMIMTQITLNQCSRSMQKTVKILNSSFCRTRKTNSIISEQTQAQIMEILAVA